MQNLEPLAALGAERLVGDGHNPGAKDIENLVNKALGVLSAQGVYAFGLFLLSRTRAEDQRVAERIHDACAWTLREVALVAPGQFVPGKIQEMDYRHLCENGSHETPGQGLYRLLLTKKLLETMLIYARYAAKARGIEARK